MKNIPICERTLEIFSFQRKTPELWSTNLSSIVEMENPQVMKYITLTFSTSLEEKNKLSVFYDFSPKSKKLIDESIKKGRMIYNGLTYSHTVENIYGLSNSIYLGFVEEVFFKTSSLEMVLIENILKEKEWECEIFWIEACSKKRKEKNGI